MYLQLFMIITLARFLVISDESLHVHFYFSTSYRVHTFSMHCRSRVFLDASGDVLQGQAVGTAAHLVGLRREAIGKYNVKDAWTVEQLQAAVTELREKKALGKAADAASHDGTHGSVRHDQVIAPDSAVDK